MRGENGGGWEQLRGGKRRKGAGQGSTTPSRLCFVRPVWKGVSPRKPRPAAERSARVADPEQTCAGSTSPDGGRARPRASPEGEPTGQSAARRRRSQVGRGPGSPSRARGRRGRAHLSGARPASGPNKGSGEGRPARTGPLGPRPRHARGRCVRWAAGTPPAWQEPRGRGAAEPGLGRRTCPPRAPAAPAAPAARTCPPSLLTSARPGPAPRRRGPRPAPLHALSPPSAPPAAPGPPPPLPAPSRRRPLRGHNGAAAPLMHMHDAARRPRPQTRAVEPRVGARAGLPRACAGRSDWPSRAELGAGGQRGRRGTNSGAPSPLHTFPNAASAEPLSFLLAFRRGGARWRGGT